MDASSIQVRQLSFHACRPRVHILQICFDWISTCNQGCNSVCGHRDPGEDKVSEKWAAAMEMARQGHITHLKVLTLDVIMAPKDGLDR